MTRKPREKKQMVSRNKCNLLSKSAHTLTSSSIPSTEWYTTQGLYLYPRIMTKSWLVTADFIKTQPLSGKSITRMLSLKIRSQNLPVGVTLFNGLSFSINKTQVSLHMHNAGTICFVQLRHFAQNSKNSILQYKNTALEDNHSTKTANWFVFILDSLRHAHRLMWLHWWCQGDGKSTLKT